MGRRVRRQSVGNGFLGCARLRKRQELYEFLRGVRQGRLLERCFVGIPSQRLFLNLGVSMDSLYTSEGGNTIEAKVHHDIHSAIGESRSALR